jgi:hypothetical protein
MVSKQGLQQLLILLKAQQTAPEKPLDLILQFGLGVLRHCGES